MHTGTNILQFEKIPPFTGGVADDNSDPQNTSIFVSPISIFVSATTTVLRLDNARQINSTQRALALLGGMEQVAIAGRITGPCNAPRARPRYS